MKDKLKVKKVKQKENIFLFFAIGLLGLFKSNNVSRKLVVMNKLPESFYVHIYKYIMLFT